MNLRLYTCLVMIGLLVVAGCGPSNTASMNGEQKTFDLSDGANPYEPGALVGTSVEDFPDSGLVNQFGETVSMNGLPARPVAIGFIYTNCPMPGMCPLVTLKMKRLQKRFQREGEPAVHFILISFDPKNDDPGTLKHYGDKRNINYGNFSFWTGPPSTIDRLTGKFKIHTRPGQHQTITHNLRLYLLDETHVVRYYWRGNDWKVEDVEQRLRELISS